MFYKAVYPRLSPDLVRYLYDQAEFGGLLFMGESIAGSGAGEAALRRKAKLVQAQILCRRVNPAFQFILAFQLTELA